MQRLVRRQVASLVGGGLALIVLAVPAVAVGSHPPVGRIVAQSSKVQIQGELEDGDLTGSFRLRAAGASVPASDYYFFMGDLRGVNGTTGSVGREHVKLPDPLDLPAGGRRNFTLAVSALTRPGTYRGILKVIRIARPRSPAAPITIEIRATRRPAPRVIGGVPVKLTATKPIVPSLDTFLDPLLGYTQQAKVELDNPVTAHLPVHDGAADMRRDFDGRSPAIKLGPDEHRELSQWNATTDRTLVIRVSPTQEEPGRYTGEILIELVNIDTRFAIPTELNIKYGPLLPLGVLVASVVLGIGLRRLVRWFSARRRTRKSKDALTKRINDLQRDVEEIVAAATDLPGPQIPERPRGARVIELNADMEKYETRKANKGDAQKVARDVAEQLIAQLASARWLVVADAFSEATKVCDLVSDTVRTWQRMRNAWNTFRRMEPELDERARLEARRLLGEALWQWSEAQLLEANTTLDRLEARQWAWQRYPERFEEAPLPLEPELQLDDFRRQYNLLGPEPGALLQIVRPLFAGAATSIFYLALIVVLAVAAMQFFYVNNDTFGAHFTDWLPLGGWGLATDPVSNALTKLRDT